MCVARLRYRLVFYLVVAWVGLRMNPCDGFAGFVFTLLVGSHQIPGFDAGVDRVAEDFVVWSKTEALERTDELFAAVLRGVPQRVRMPDGQEILLIPAFNVDAARKGYDFLAQAGRGPDDDPTDER